MKKETKDYFSKRRVCALLTVIILIANMFSPYGVLINPSYASGPADGEPYFILKLHEVEEDITKLPDDPGEWPPDSYYFYYDYANGDCDTPEESVHVITMDLIIKCADNVNQGVICLQIPSSLITPVFENSKGAGKNKVYWLEDTNDWGKFR